VNPLTLFWTFFWKSSIGKKWIVALTGIVLVGYVLGHLAGNLQVFAGPAQINAYAQFLHSMPRLLWVIRAFLIVCFVLHIVVTIRLALENRAAKPNPGAFRNRVQAKIATRTMAISGLIVLCFVIFHLLHLTARATDSRFRPLEQGGLLHGEYDVYSMLVLAFDPHGLGLWVALFYLLGVGLLCLHLSHGFSSLLQTLGLTTKTTISPLTVAGQVLALLIFLGYASIPLGVWFGALKLQTSL
jgi:succinate dehydrogenase / fumarate reductase, cytochrome b subunit